MSNPLIPANQGQANLQNTFGVLGTIQAAGFPVNSMSDRQRILGINKQGLEINKDSSKISKNQADSKKPKITLKSKESISPKNRNKDPRINSRSVYRFNKRDRQAEIRQERSHRKTAGLELDYKISSDAGSKSIIESSNTRSIMGQQASLSELFSQTESIRQNSFYECAMSNSKDRSLYTLSLSQDFDLVYTVKIGTRASINRACSFTLTDGLSSHVFNITKLQDFSPPGFTFNEQRTNCTKLISGSDSYGIYFKIKQDSNGLLSFGYCQSDGAFFPSCVYSENSDILRQVTNSTTPAKAVFSCNSTASGFEIFNDDNNEKVVKLSLERNLANASFYENLISFDSEKKLILRDGSGNNYVFNNHGNITRNALNPISSSADSKTYLLQDAKCCNYFLTFNLTGGEVQSAIIIEGHSNVGIGFNIDSEGRLNSNGIKDGRIINNCYLNNQNSTFTENCIIDEIDSNRSLVYEASFLSGEKKEYSVEITKRDNQFENLSLAINFSGSYLGLSINPNSNIDDIFNSINQTIAKKGFLAKLEDNKIVFYGRYDGLEIKLNLKKKDNNLFEFEFENKEGICGVLSESSDVLKGTTTTTPPRNTSSPCINPEIIYKDYTCNISSNRVMTIYNPQLQQEAEIKLIKDQKNINYTKSVYFKIGDDNFTIDYDNVTFGEYVYGHDDLCKSNITFGDRWLLKKTGENSYEIYKDNLKIRQEYVQNGEIKISVTNNSQPILNCDFDNQGNITQSFYCSPDSLVSNNQGVVTTAVVANNTFYTGTSTNSSHNYVSTTLNKLIGYLNEYCDKFINTSSLDKPPSLLHSLNDSAIHDLMFDDNETASNNTISKKNLDNFIKNLENINKLSPDPNISSYIEKLKSCKADEGNGPNYSLAIGLGVTSFLFLVGCIICCLNFRENEREKAPVAQNQANQAGQNQGNQAGQNQANQAHLILGMLPEDIHLPPNSESPGVGISGAGNEEKSDAEAEAAAESEVTKSTESTESPELEDRENIDKLLELQPEDPAARDEGHAAGAEVIPVAPEEVRIEGEVAPAAGAEDHAARDEGEAAPAAGAFSRDPAVAPARGVEEAGGVGLTASRLRGNLNARTSLSPS